MRLNRLDEMLKPHCFFLTCYLSVPFVQTSLFLFLYFPLPLRKHHLRIVTIKT